MQNVNITTATIYCAVAIAVIVAGILITHFSGRKKKEGLQLEIKFHREANLHGEHGTLIASHRKFGLQHFPVRFVFVGVATPPAMDLALFTYVWNQALDQGFIPHALGSYGVINEGVYPNRELAAPSLDQQYQPNTAPVVG